MLRNLLLSGIICLTLSACGGGGGGGDNHTSDDSHIGNSSSGNDNSSTVAVNAPSGLSVGQKVSLTISGSAVPNASATFSYTIASLNDSSGTSGKLTNGSAFEYKKTGSNTAIFKFRGDTWSNSTMTSLSSFEYTLQFNDKQSGNITRSYEYTSMSGTAIHHNVGTFRITGRSTSGGSSSSDSGSSSSGSGSSSSGNSSSSGSGSTTVSGNAPVSLEGYYLDWGTKGDTSQMKKIGFEGGRATIVPANVSGTYTYTRESANSGKLKIDIPGTVGEFYKTRDNVTLSFSSGSSVSVTGIMGLRAYTNESIQYGKGKVSITQDSTDDDSSDDTNEDSKNFAPSSLSDQYLTIKQGNNTLFVYKLDASGKVTVKHRFDDKANITLSPAGSYTYTKNGANTATLVATHKYITAVDHEEKSYKTTTGVFRYTLTFSGNKVGVAEEKGVMFKTYTFSLNSVSSTSPENDDDSDDTGDNGEVSDAIAFNIGDTISFTTSNNFFTRETGDNVTHFTINGKASATLNGLYKGTYLLEKQGERRYHFVFSFNDGNAEYMLIYPIEFDPASDTKGDIYGTFTSYKTVNNQSESYRMSYKGSFAIVK